MQKIIHETMQFFRQAGIKCDELSILKVFSAFVKTNNVQSFNEFVSKTIGVEHSFEKFYPKLEILKNTAKEERYNLVKTLLALDFGRKQLMTPRSIYNFFILKNMQIDEKILLPDVKTGGVILELLYEFDKKFPNSFDKIFQNIEGYCSNNHIFEFVQLASEFIFNEQFLVKNEQFLLSKTEEKFDIVICNPPFGRLVKGADLSFISENKTKSIEILFLEKISNLMKESSKAAIILPNSFFENENYEKIRQWTKNNFAIEKIISLPTGIFKPAANIKTGILFLSKKQNKNQKIEFMILNDSNNINDFTAFEIEEKDFSTLNFAPQYYYRKIFNPQLVFDDSKYVELSKIAKIKKDKASILKNPQEFVNYVDISSVDAKIGKIIQSKKIEVSKAPKRAYYEINTNDLIVAVSGTALGTKAQSMAVVEKEYDSSICSNGFRVLSLKSDINPYYLWYFMRSDAFLKQVEMHCSGSTILNLKENDFLSLKVYIPSFEIQNKIAKKVIENIQKYTISSSFLLKAEDELKNLLNGENNDNQNE